MEAKEIHALSMKTFMPGEWGEEKGWGSADLEFKPGSDQALLAPKRDK